MYSILKNPISKFCRPTSGVGVSEQGRTG